MLQILKQKNPDVDVDIAYLERLKTIPHSVFQTEIDQLAESSAKTADALTSTGANYCDNFVALGDNISTMLEYVDSLGRSSTKARKSASRVPHQLPTAYADIERVLSKEHELYTHLDQIQELVSIPALARSCVQSGMYPPAHDIFAFVQRLRTRYPKSSIVERIGADTLAVILEMRDILVKLLRESSKVQVLIKTLTLLRKLEPFKSSPSEVLRQVFIESRIEFMRTDARLLAPLETSSPAMYLKRYVEQFREHVGGAISCMSTVFGPTVAASQFARRSISDLTKKLNEVYPRVTDDKSRVLLQLTYCSSSLGRLGVEFWPLIDCDIPELEWLEAYNTQQALSKAASEREDAK